MKKKKKPLAAWLPGQFGRMTREELDAESNRYEAEFSAMRATPIPNAKLHPKKRGRPPKLAGEKAARVLITLTPTLLAAADAAAQKCGLTRAALIRQAVLNWLERPLRPRKTA